MDGYYDGMIFHRILGDFLVQTGLVRGAAGGGGGDLGEHKKIDTYLNQSTAVLPSASGCGDPLGWERKKLELNPRIRFNHRGQVAAAFPLKSTDEQAGEEEKMALRYQFFITLDESPFLDANHVIFGTISGPTIFNALRIGKTDVDEATGAPIDMDNPPTIKSVKIDYHPFKDVVVTPEAKLPWKTSAEEGGQSDLAKRRKKRKGKRDLNVLSFGDEERDYEAIVSQSGQKKGAIQSSHDVLHGESTFLSSGVDADLEKKMLEMEESSVIDKRKVKDGDDASKEKKKRIKFNNDISQNEVGEPIMQQESKLDNIASAIKDRIKNELTENKAKPTRQHEAVASKIAEQKQSTKSKSISAVEARRAKYLKGGASLASKKERLKREDDTMAKLMAFRSKVLETKGSKKDNSEPSKEVADDSLAARMAQKIKRKQDEEARVHKEREDKISMPGYHGQVDEKDSGSEDDANNSWMESKFKCKKHIDRDSRTATLDKSEEGGDGRHMDDYLVVDEKGGKKGRHHRHHGNREDGMHRRSW